MSVDSQELAIVSAAQQANPILMLDQEQVKPITIAIFGPKIVWCKKKLEGLLVISRQKMLSQFPLSVTKTFIDRTLLLSCRQNIRFVDQKVKI